MTTDFTDEYPIKPPAPRLCLLSTVSLAAGRREQNASILPSKGGTTNSENPPGQSPEKFPTNKIFLPRIPRLGADGFHPSNSHRPARPGPAQPSSQLIKQPIGGRKISWAGHDRPPTPDPAKKWAVKDGDFCSRHFNTSPDGNAHRFGTPQISEQQPFNLPDPESTGKIISGSSLLGNSHCWERGCKRSGQSSQPQAGGPECVKSSASYRRPVSF